MRLANEVDKRLNSMVTKFHGAKKLGDFEDNATRMRATELLADLRGKRKTQLNISGEIMHKGYITISPDDWDDDDSGS